MAFLTDDDYDVQTRQELLAVIAQSSLSREKAELMAQAQITEAINKRYDTVATFAATGDDRSIIVIMYMIDITLYHLHSKTATRAIPKIRETRFEAAKEWLKLVNGGKLNPDLPEVEDDPDDSESYLGSAGSNPQRFREW